jgi:hypothetical protein
MKHVLRVVASMLAIGLLAACDKDTLANPPTPTLSPAAAVRLSKGVPVSNITGAKNSQKFYTLRVPAGATNLKFTLSGGAGNADLYVKFGSAPTPSSYACRPFKAGNYETCTFASPRVGTYHVLIRGRTAYSGLKLLGQYQTATTSSNYNITFVFGPNITASQKQLFTNAANRWRQVITGDVANGTLNKPANACGANEPAFSGAIDDIVIYAEVGPIDGPNSILAQAGPCYIRNNNYLPTYGVMKFDSADVSSFNLTPVILHEMGHVFGLGTLWPYLDLVNYEPGSCPSSPRYLGASALQEWRAFGKTGNIPVENGGGQGTACGHWDEETFSNELMTGYIEERGSMPLSRMTAGSLQDMGYVANKAAADAYSLPACSPSCLKAAAARPQGKEVLIQPVGIVFPNGETRSMSRFR